MKLALALLGIIGISAVLGTLIPQQHEAREFFLQRHPMSGALFQKFGFFDLYHSAWFLALEGLLVLNLIACTWRRLPGMWRRFRGEDDPGPGYPPGRTFFLEGPLDQNERRIEKTIQDRYGKGFGAVRWKDASDSRIAVLRRNAFSCLGVPVVHLGVLMIMAGAVAGAWFGFEGEAIIPQGEAVQTIRLKDGGERELGFQVRCDKFTAEFYSSGAPREYRSDVSFIKQGQAPQQAVLRVNEPAAFEGIRFYQSSYGSIPGSFVLTVRDGRGKEKTVRVKRGESFDLPEARASVSVLRAEDNLMGFGPGIKLLVESSGRETEFWVFKNIDELVRENPGLLERAPLLDPGRFKPYRFALREMETKPYTGLMVSRDPGVPFVFAGFVILIAGCIAIYLFPSQLIKISAGPGDGRVRVGVSGRLGRSRAASEPGTGWPRRSPEK